MKKILTTLILIISFSTIIFSQTQTRTKFDFDGDGKADLSIFRPNGGFWIIRGSSGGTTTTQFGLATDKLVSADYDGDGKADVAVYRSDNARSYWYIISSITGSFSVFTFGESGDLPVPNAPNH